MCSYPVHLTDERSKQFHVLWLDESTRVRRVFFGCPLGQKCCDVKCCSQNMQQTGATESRMRNRERTRKFCSAFAVYSHTVYPVRLSSVRGREILKFLTGAAKCEIEIPK